MCNVQVDRAQKNFSIQKVKVEKDNTWKRDIAEVVSSCCETGMVPDITLPCSTQPTRLTMPMTRVSINYIEQCITRYLHPFNMYLMSKI